MNTIDTIEFHLMMIIDNNKVHHFDMIDDYELINNANVNNVLREEYFLFKHITS